MPLNTTRLPSQRWLTILLLAYLGLAIYGSLYPLTAWHPAATGLIQALADSLNGHASRADMVVNLLVYMPLGLMLAVRWQARWPSSITIVFATACGLGLSLAMEWIQLYLPSRTTSLIDILLNTLGTALGAALPLLASDRFPLGRRVHALRVRWIDTGPVASFGLMVVAVWALSQLTPFVPSLDLGNLRAGMSPLFHTLIAPLTFDLGKALAYALSLLAIGLVAVSLLRPDRTHRWLVAGAMLVAVLLAKVPIVARSLSAEAAMGAIVAVVGLRFLERVEARQLLAIVAFCLVGAYAVEQLRPGTGAVSGDLQWRLFSMQMLNIHGLQDILADIWPFLGLAYVAQRAGLPGRPAIVAAGAVAVATLAGALEWVQTTIPGRHADVTDIVLALVGWTLPWMNPALRNA